MKSLRKRLAPGTHTRSTQWSPPRSYRA